MAPEEFLQPFAVIATKNRHTESIATGCRLRMARVIDFEKRTSSTCAIRRFGRLQALTLWSVACYLVTVARTESQIQVCIDVVGHEFHATVAVGKVHAPGMKAGPRQIVERKRFDRIRNGGPVGRIIVEYVTTDVQIV